MTVLIDADGCPVVDETIRLARRFGAQVTILCDTAHVFEREGARTLTVSKGADSVDFALVNLARPGDVVVTQDYGLAAMCLARGARVLRQDGLEYTADNVEALLAARHEAKRLRRGGARLRGPAKRTPLEDQQFERALAQMLQGPEAQAGAVHREPPAEEIEKDQ